MKLVTRLGLAALGAAALGAVVLFVPDLRWRGVVVARKVTGQIQDVSWAELLDIERPTGHFELHRLAASGNPYSSVEDPDQFRARPRARQRAVRAALRKMSRHRSRGGLAPRLTGNSLRHGDSDWAIYHTITRGVPGTAMQGGLLDRPDVWRVIAYVRDLRAAADRGGRGGQRRRRESNRPRTRLRRSCSMRRCPRRSGACPVVPTTGSATRTTRKSTRPTSRGSRCNGCTSFRPRRPRTRPRPSWWAITCMSRCRPTRWWRSMPAAASSSGSTCVRCPPTCGCAA